MDGDNVPGSATAIGTAIVGVGPRTTWNHETKDVFADS
jgi:hypothetical protein